MAITAGKKLILGQGWHTTKIAAVDQTDWSSIAEVYENAWDEILRDGRFQMADFTIKVDLSTVFFPLRICKHLIELSTSAYDRIYVVTCNQSIGPSKMLGSLEILSRAAVDTFSRGKETCREELEYKTKVENVFLQQCLEMLHVSSVFQGDMLADESCEPAHCHVEKAAYSPYTNITAWLDCWKRSDEAEVSANVPVHDVEAR
jgi:hypothetical protein